MATAISGLKEDCMPLKPLQTDRAPAAIGPYSQAILAGDMLFVSGQLGMNPETGELVGPDLPTQARQALQNLKNIVIASGLSLTEVAAVDVYLTTMGDFSAFNSIYQEFFSEHRPARVVVAVSELPKGATVEIKCIAYRRTD
jgi:2-iminobutanoate/2-iminopropanoate deaminase